MKRRDLAPGDVFVYLDSAPDDVLESPGSAYGTVRVASVTSAGHYVDHHDPLCVNFEPVPSPPPGHYLAPSNYDRPVMVLRFANGFAGSDRE